MSAPDRKIWGDIVFEWAQRLPEELYVPVPKRDTIWEDICNFVFQAAEKMGHLHYNPQSAHVVQAYLESFGIDPDEMDAPLDASGFVLIEPGVNSAKAMCHPDLHAVLVALGLIEERVWAPRALPCLWRIWGNMLPDEPPEETEMFGHYLDRATATILDEVREEFGVLCTLSPDDLSRAAALLNRMGAGTDAAAVRERAAESNFMQLSATVSDRWRASRGWLNASDMARTGGLVFDGLAGRLAEGLIGRLHPGSDLYILRDTWGYQPHRH